MTGRPLRALAATLVGLTVAASDATAQTLNLRDLLTDIMQNGISLAPPTEGVDHSAHFTGEDTRQYQALLVVQDELARQVSSFPVSSSAGGFAYELDATLGTVSRPTRTFGPVYSERPYTVGEGKFNVGVSYSRFTFDRFDGMSLRDGDINLLFTHEDVNGDGTPLETPFEGDVIVADLFVDIDTEVTSFVANYGVSDRFDLGIAIPMIDVSIGILADARVLRLATEDNPDIHQFPNGSDETVISTRGSANGVGDVLLRGKYVLQRRGAALWALGGDLRLPTGEERNLLGLGEFQARATLMGSVNNPDVSPHVNLGYTYSGGSISDELNYAVGVDWAVDPKLTLAVDVLGRSFTDAREVSVESALWEYNTGTSADPVIETTTLDRLEHDDGGARHTAAASIGFKLNVRGNVLITANGFVPLTDVGLQDDFATLVGLDYSF